MIRIDQGFEPSAVEAELPVESGPRFTGWAWPAGHIALPGQTVFEISVPSSYVIVTTDAFFARVPEPGTLLLASLVLGKRRYEAGKRGRSAGATTPHTPRLLSWACSLGTP